MLPSLEPRESTVGTEIEIRHLAATPVGQKVTCLARVIQTTGTVISFQLEARDEHKLIARGSHKLKVICVDRCATKIQRKVRSD